MLGKTLKQKLDENVTQPIKSAITIAITALVIAIISFAMVVFK